MNILGISAFYHDSAACLMRDGKIFAAAQEERFTRKKHDHRFPKHAVEYCLKEAQITPDQLDHVVFYDKPWIKFERLAADRNLPRLRAVWTAIVYESHAAMAEEKAVDG